MVDYFYWRFKIWFSPHEETRFIIRCRRISAYYAIYLISLFFIECLFGIETSLTGVCSGIATVETEYQFTRFTVYATGFNNKREIKFFVKANYLSITEGGGYHCSSWGVFKKSNIC